MQNDCTHYIDVRTGNDVTMMTRRKPTTYITYIHMTYYIDSLLLVDEHILPRMMLAESEDGLLLDTVQVYSPPVVTVRVCVYCAVTGSSNTVSFPSVTVMESLVQVTVVAGPPVEIQVRVISTESNVTSPDIVMSPVLIQF